MVMRLLFAGTPDVALPSLRLLAGDPEHFQVMAVLTRPDAPKGRGRRLEPSPVKAAALELGIPVIESDPGEADFIDTIQRTGAEYAAVVAYGKILKRPVLDAMPGGWYNLHFSLLPQWRGAAPVQRAIWSGETITGATVFRLTPGMDEGPILAQSTVEIGAHETSGQLLERLAEDGSHLLGASLEALAEGRALPIEQPQGAYEVARKVTSQDAHIRFDRPVFVPDRQIRACTPNPGAWCRIHEDGENGDRITQVQVIEAAPAQPDQPGLPEDLKPGRLGMSKKHIWVGTASAPLELLQVKAAGKKAMKAIDWARGARLEKDAFCD